jgi:hypothetical protein
MVGGERFLVWQPPAWYVLWWGGAAVVFVILQLAQIWLLLFIWRALR